MKINSSFTQPGVALLAYALLSI